MSRYILMLVLFLALLTPGCAIEVFQDSIATTVEVPATRTTEIVTASKRFRFERDVSAAKNAVLYRAWVAVQSPDAVDLSFVGWVNVYVIHPITGERVLAARGEGFRPGDRKVELFIEIEGDVREFVNDQRVSLEWEVQPNVLYRADPESDTVELRFGVVLEVET